MHCEELIAEIQMDFARDGQPLTHAEAAQVLAALTELIQALWASQATPTDLTGPKDLPLDRSIPNGQEVEVLS